MDLKKIRECLEKPLKEMDIRIDDITYQNKNLEIVIDNDDVIDLDLCVEASRLINKIIDELDITEEEYILDVHTKEKGCANDEQ